MDRLNVESLQVIFVTVVFNKMDLKQQAFQFSLKYFTVNPRFKFPPFSGHHKQSYEFIIPEKLILEISYCLTPSNIRYIFRIISGVFLRVTLLYLKRYLLGSIKNHVRLTLQHPKMLVLLRGFSQLPRDKTDVHAENHWINFEIIKSVYRNLKDYLSFARSTCLTLTENC